MSGSEFVEKIEPMNGLFMKPGVKRLGHLDLELTERCDNNCKHCSINISENSPAKSRELNTDEWKKIINEAADLGVIRIRFTGGEPMLREDFSELYLYTRKLGIKVIIFTNARKITEETAKLLSKFPPMEKIEVSVYGMKKESYEKVSRVPESYKEFKNGIDLLLEYKIPFVVKGIHLQENKHERKEFENWALSLPWTDQLPSFSGNFELRERRDSEKKNKVIRSLRIESGPDTGQIKSITSKIEFIKKFTGPAGEDLFTCGAGDSISVDAYGSAHPCLTLKADEFGFDLKKGSLKEAFLEFFPEKLKGKAENGEYIRRCSKCVLKGLCLQCPSRSWSEYSTFDTPVEYLCKVAHREAVDIGLLKEDEKGWEVKNWKERIKNLEDDENVKVR